MKVTRTLRVGTQSFGALSPGILNRTLTYVDDNGATQTAGYKLCVPVGYDYRQPTPTILSLVGDGRNGNDNTSQMLEGFSLWASNNIGSITSVVVCPQAPAVNANGIGVFPSIYLEAWRLTLLEVNADQQRLGLIGVSRGAEVAWGCALRNLGQFAFIAGFATKISETRVDWALHTSGTTQAAAPGVCYSYLGPAGQNTAIYSHHYADDITVDVNRDRPIAAAWGAPFVTPFNTAPAYAGAPLAYQYDSGLFRYVEEPTGGHAWDTVIASAAFQTWYTAQHK